MRKLILKMSVTLDGFVGGPNGEIDWIYKSMSPDVMDWLCHTLSRAGAHIMGSRTYQDMASYWPYSTDPLAASMNQIPKVVFSQKGQVTPSVDQTTTAFKQATRIHELNGKSSADILEGWRRPVVFSGDLVEEIAKLKGEPGKDILAHGGARFAQSLSAIGLVDEYHLLIHPVALGQGLSLFSTSMSSLHLDLLESTQFKSGAMANIYKPNDLQNRPITA